MSNCHRCGKETSVTIMSMFNTQIICMDCSDKERQSPRFKEARDADERAIRAGNYNFNGIGLG